MYARILRMLLRMHSFGLFLRGFISSFIQKEREIVSLGGVILLLLQHRRVYPGCLILSLDLISAGGKKNSESVVNWGEVSVSRLAELVGSCLNKRRQVGPFLQFSLMHQAVLLPQVSDESAGMFVKPACEQTSLNVSASYSLITLNWSELKAAGCEVAAGWLPVLLHSVATVCGDALRRHVTGWTCFLHVKLEP